MNVREIPIQVFGKVGKNHEVRSSYVAGLCDGIKYAQTPQGFWLELRETHECVILTLWGCEESARNSSERGSSYFRLYAGIQDGGSWTSGEGTALREVAELSIDKNVNIHRPIALDVAYLIFTTLRLKRRVKLELCGSQ